MCLSLSLKYPQTDEKKAQLLSTFNKWAPKPYLNTHTLAATHKNWPGPLYLLLFSPVAFTALLSFPTLKQLEPNTPYLSVSAMTLFTVSQTFPITLLCQVAWFPSKFQISLIYISRRRWGGILDCWPRNPACSLAHDWWLIRYEWFAMAS